MVEKGISVEQFYFVCAEMWFSTRTTGMQHEHPDFRLVVPPCVCPLSSWLYIEPLQLMHVNCFGFRLVYARHFRLTMGSTRGSTLPIQCSVTRDVAGECPEIEWNTSPDGFVETSHHEYSHVYACGYMY